MFDPKYITNNTAHTSTNAGKTLLLAVYDAMFTNYGGGRVGRAAWRGGA